MSNAQRSTSMSLDACLWKAYVAGRLYRSVASTVACLAPNDAARDLM